jgi:hypothetical protein
MTRTALWAPTALILTFAVVAAPAAASERAKCGCESDATNCLGRCASIDTRTAAGKAEYNKCVPDCDRKRNECFLFSTRK